MVRDANADLPSRWRAYPGRCRFLPNPNSEAAASRTFPDEDYSAAALAVAGER